MRYSKLVLLSTLSAFALLTASTTSRAVGPSVTDMGLLRPHDTWNVGAINAKNADYCAMVGQFDKEISLAFARNSKGSGSLAISFPGGILDTGMMYEVTLQVDDLQARQYNVRASSPRSLIVQIGQDEDFYSSLGSNGTLHIGLPTVDMRFDLKKFSSSYISLITCADKLPQQHDGPRTAAVPVTPVEKTPLAGTSATKTAAAATYLAPVTLTPPSALKNSAILTPFAPPTTGITWSETQKKAPDIVANKTAHENVDINEENMELKSKLAQAEMQQTEMTNSINLLKSEKYDLQTKLDVKDKQSKLLEAALNAKDRDLSSVRSISNDDGKSLADTQAELAALKRDHALAIAELETKLADKSAQYDNLQKQFTDGTEVRHSAQEQSAQAQTELETLRQRLAQAQTQLASSDQQKSDMATQLEFQGQQNKSLLERVQEQLSKATQQVSLLESQLMSVGMQRDDLASQLDAEANKNKALQANLDVKQRELAYMATTKSLSGTGQHASSALEPEVSEADDIPFSGNHTSSPPSGGRNNMNLSSSERSTLPAITQQQTIGQDDMPSAPVLKASAAGVGRTSGSGDDNWQTVVVQ